MTGRSPSIPPLRGPADGRLAIVLAGGRSSRMGVDKATLRREGRLLLGEVVRAAGRVGPVVVVAPDAVAAAGVDRQARELVRAVVLEDPPFGGPVAGIAAGLAAGTHAVPDAGEVVVLACDLPRADDLVRALVSAAGDAALEGADAVCPLDEQGVPQPLAARYRATALRGAVAGLPTARDVSVRRLVAPLRFGHVPAPPGATEDVDTPQAAARHGLELP